MNIPGDDNGPRDWRPTDPRQIETHRRLRLFGEAPAGHYYDACRMMDRLDLRATTHLVGISLRELESAIRGVLRSMLSAEQRAAIALEEGFTHREQIEQICTLLGFDDDDEIRARWWTFASRLSRYTHRATLRAPRPVDDEFREWWALGQAVLHRITHQFETIYGEALPGIEDLAAIAEPARANLSALREEVPHGDVALDRFFATATPGWFQLLRGGGYFADPPPLQPDEEGRVAYVPWPPGQYLVRLAAEDEYRTEVVALARALAEADNPAAREAVVEIALAIPPAAAAELAGQVAAYLATPQQWRLPYRARDLVIHLAQGGQTAAALALLRPLVSPAPRQGDQWHSRSLLEGLVPELFPALGLAGLELLASLLDAQLEEDPRTSTRDYSYIWRPTLEGGRRQDFRDAVVSALRDGTARVVEADPTQLAAIVAFLEARGPSIYARLALDLLRRFPGDDLVAARLGDRVRFDNLSLEREYTLLARERFAALPNEVRERILGWVDAGPDQDGDSEDPEGRRERWQLTQLARLGDDLPEEWRARRDELIARHGEPEARSSRGAIWSGGPTAPLSKEELGARSVDEILDYLRSWTPEGEFGAPSAEGLSRLLAEVVAEDPARFAAAAETFIDVEPTYARALITGLVKAAWAEAEFNWAPVLAFARAALEQPRLIEGRPERGNDLDPGWIGTRLEIARLLSAGLEKNLIASERADEVWEILAVLAEDAEPDLAYEDEWADGGMGPSGLSLNSVRGSAMHAVMHYAWWRKEQMPAGETPALEPRLSDLLERHLNPAVDPTRTVRAVYGQWFPFLVPCDGEWAAVQASAIFALDGEHAALGRVAWGSYLSHNPAYTTAVERLRPQYVAAVERAITGDGGDDEVRQALISHLVALYARGEVDLDDGLFGRFLAEAPVELRAQVFEAMGIGLMNEEEDVGEDRLARLHALWERRLAVAVDAGDRAAFRELTGFAWWFGSGRFEDEWALARLAELLEAGGTVDPDHVVAERLVALHETHLAEVVRALAALIDATVDPWFVLGSRDEMRTILRAGLASEEEEVRNVARAATNRLVARGHPDFGDLLQ